MVGYPWYVMILNCRLYFIPCSPSPGIFGRLDLQFARGRLFYWCRVSVRVHVLHPLRIPEHDLDVHDMLPFSASREGSPRTSRTGIRVVLFFRCRGRRQICAPVHTHGNRLLSVVVNREFDVGSVRQSIHLDDGMLFHFNGG